MINEESLERRRVRRREVGDADVDELDDATKQSQNKIRSWKHYFIIFNYLNLFHLKNKS